MISLEVGCCTRPVSASKLRSRDPVGFGNAETILDVDGYVYLPAIQSISVQAGQTLITRFSVCVEQKIEAVQSAHAVEVITTRTVI